MTGVQTCALPISISSPLLIKLDNAKQTITWINNGEDIAQPFTIDVEVCVNHKWGGICDHTWKNGLGHSVGTIQIQVKKHNDK